jgi:hypothetical protein
MSSKDSRYAQVVVANSVFLQDRLVSYKLTLISRRVWELSSFCTAVAIMQQIVWLCMLMLAKLAAYYSEWSASKQQGQQV